MRARVVALAVASAMLVAGCGVPSSTEVQVDGPVAEQGAPGDDQPRLPPGPDEARNVAQLVDNFLQAAAGDPVDPVEQVRAFLHKDHQQSWRPDDQVLLVRVEDVIITPAALSRHRIELPVRVTGVLRDGMILPREGPDERRYEFEVVDEVPAQDRELDITDPRWRIVDPPPAILLSDEALSVSLTNPGYLEPSPIYFWDSDYAVLVPDLRWLPTAFPARQRAQLKLQWLIEGPAPWLGSAARIPGEVALEGNIVWTDRRVDVTLTPAAKEVDQSHLDTQLWWTLRDEVGDDRHTWLTIDGAERLVEAVDGANAAAVGLPASFLVVDGELLQYLAGDEVERVAIPDVSGTPGEIRSAALNRDGQAALVHYDPDGLYRLSVASGEGITPTDLYGAAMSRPVWLAYSDGAGLVATDGELYQFAEHADPVPVPTPGVTGDVTALAVAPDGRRMALIAGGDLYVASLTRRDGVVVVSTARRLPTTGSDLAGVTFLQENWLAVVGRDGGRSLLYELTIDGAVERELANGGLGAPGQVTNVVGSPGDALASDSRRGEVMYEADGILHRYQYPYEPESVSVAELQLDPDEVTSPPRAPLYLE